jgi:hypothetical protein
VQLAVDIPNFGHWGDPRRVVELARNIEVAGWDGLSMWDHIYVFEGNVVADPWATLGAVAAATDHLTLMTMVTPLPRRRPWQVARQAVTIDHLSGGRLILGVGIGHPPGPELAVFGEETGTRRRAEMLDEGLEIISGLWSGEEFSYRGDHYRLQKVTFAPRPLQHPRIPIWVAATWPNRRPFRRAARWDGVAPLVEDDEIEGGYRPPHPDELEPILAYLAEHRTAAEPIGVTVATHLPPGQQGVERAAAYREAGVTWLRDLWGPWLDEPFEAWLDRVQHGTP